jgi:AcrR family transcriptional regulator
MPSPITRSRATARAPRKAKPSLAMKKPPSQQRSAETFERILEVAARTLADVGIDRLSTNLICERAGLTPPALYRYFPNKYAVLCELGLRLMARQNELIPRWITREALSGSEQTLQPALQGLLLDTYRVTRETVAGLWITRALRAVPALAKVRVESHAEVTQMQIALLSAIFPQADTNELRLVSRIATELLYAAVEMLFEERSLDSESVARMVSTMVAGYVVHLERPPANSARPVNSRRGRS